MSSVRYWSCIGWLSHAELPQGETSHSPSSRAHSKLTRCLLLSLSNQLLFPSRVFVSFIIIDPVTNRPMRADRALALLEETNALERLRASGYNAEGFAAAAPPPAVAPGECVPVYPTTCGITAAILKYLLQVPSPRMLVE